MNIVKHFLAIILFVTVAGFGLVIPAVPVQAQTAEQTLLKINLSGRQRMLAQRMAGLSCLVHLGIEPETRSREALEIRALFIQTLDALAHGSEESGLGAERAPRVLAGIDEVTTQIDQMSALLSPLEYNGEIDKERLLSISATSSALFEVSNHLVSHIQSAHSGQLKNLSMIDSMIVNIAGRQRMLSEKAFKEFCMLQAGVQTAANTESLSNTVKVFDNTLNALISGMPGMIIAPPTEEIRAKLEEARALWTPVKRTLERALAGDRFDNATILQASNDLEQLRNLMNEVVTLYQQAN